MAVIRRNSSGMQSRQRMLALMWCTTFIATICGDVNFGLLCGLGLCIATFLAECRPRLMRMCYEKDSDGVITYAPSQPLHVYERGEADITPYVFDTDSTLDVVIYRLYCPRLLRHWTLIRFLTKRYFLRHVFARHQQSVIVDFRYVIGV
jgi:hypothetical protein